MTKDYPAEQWKTVTFNIEFTNEFRLEVSNFGRLRTFNKISDGNIVKGSMVNGYRILRLKLYKPRDEKTQTKLDNLQQQVYKLQRKLKSLKDDKESATSIKEATNLLADFKKNVSKKFQDDLKERTIHYHSLVHRLVATYFLKKPTTQQTIVAHLDHNKLNNRANNLKWMTSQENIAHQQSSPDVIKEKSERKFKRDANVGNTKLSVTKVMLLKKLLNQQKSPRELVKIFKVTETQILRIKRGENWGDIKAAR